MPKLFLLQQTFKDAVFTRTWDLQDPNAVFVADFFYHNDWMRNYLYRYESRSKGSAPPKSRQQPSWIQIVPELIQGLNTGKGYELGAPRNYLNTVDEQCNFRNRDVKIFLMNQFGAEIAFTYPRTLNKSMMVFRFSSNVLAENIRSVDSVELCAKGIRESLDEHTFQFDGCFCDAQDLKTACNDKKIPAFLLTFLWYLYNFSPENYKKSSKTGDRKKSSFTRGW